MSLKPKFSLKKKLVLLFTFIIIMLSMLAGLFSYKGINDVTKTMYLSRSKEASATIAALLEPEMVQRVKQQVLDIFYAAEDRVSTEEWGSPEFDAYLDKYAGVENSDDFKTIQRQLRLVQDNNNLKKSGDYLFLAQG